jgi:archaellum component FlaC
VTDLETVNRSLSKSVQSFLDEMRVLDKKINHLVVVCDDMSDEIERLRDALHWASDQFIENNLSHLSHQIRAVLEGPPKRHIKTPEDGK